MRTDEHRARIREVRRRLAQDGPPRTRDIDQDFETVTLPERDCDLLRDLLIAEGVETVVEVGLAYASSALAIGEALIAVDSPHPRHVIVDPLQETVWSNVGWDLLRSAELDSITRLMLAPSSLALPQLLTEGSAGAAGNGGSAGSAGAEGAAGGAGGAGAEGSGGNGGAAGLVADAAFVDGSHRFHEVFVDLYFLRKIVRPGGLIIVDDYWTPAVRTAVCYYEQNLGWTVIPDAFAGGTVGTIGAETRGNPATTRGRALRLPDPSFEPPFEEFRPF